MTKLARRDFGIFSAQSTRYEMDKAESSRVESDQSWRGIDESDRLSFIITYERARRLNWEIAEG